MRKAEQAEHCLVYRDYFKDLTGNFTAEELASFLSRGDSQGCIRALEAAQFLVKLYPHILEPEGSDTSWPAALWTQAMEYHFQLWGQETLQ